MKNIDLKDLLSKVKIVVSEMDGVVNDGKMSVAETGITVYKDYSIKDFEVINLIKKKYKFVFMSSDNSVNYLLCSHKNIPFFWAQKDKKETLHKILQRYSFGMDEVLYIGSKPSDLSMVKYVPISMCPRDSLPSLKSYCSYRFKAKGGEGVLCELHELLYRWNYENSD